MPNLQAQPEGTAQSAMRVRATVCSMLCHTVSRGGSGRAPFSLPESECQYCCALCCWFMQETEHIHALNRHERYFCVLG
jgi:hypothetical protein